MGAHQPRPFSYARPLFQGLGAIDQPEIDQSSRTHDSRTLGEPLITSLVNVLNTFGCGAVATDANGTILRFNGHAEAAFGDGLMVVQNRLRAQRPRDQVDLERLMSGCLSPVHNAQKAIAIQRPSGRKPYIVRSRPLQDAGCSQTEPFPHAAARILVLIVDPDSQAEEDCSASLRLLGLTGLEAQVAACVGGGRSPAEAATELGFTIATVRSTLKQIYGKLNINRQSELARLVTRLNQIV